MRFLCVIGISAAMLFVGGCSSMIRPESPEPALYRLEYDAGRIDCARGYDRGVRVMPFTTASPYNRTQMVVLGTGRQVMFSRNFQWVANPGTMITGKLERDLKKSALFSQVLPASDLTDVPLAFSGNILKFACERTDSKCEAVLEIEVVLKETPAEKRLFQKNYHLRSQPFAKENSALFAAAMSELAGKLSRSLRKDLCDAVAGKAGNMARKGITTARFGSP